MSQVIEAMFFELASMNPNDMRLTNFERSTQHFNNILYGVTKFFIHYNQKDESVIVIYKKHLK
jgi:hypothetical protein